MKRLKLTQGYYAELTSEEFMKCVHFKWRVNLHRKKTIYVLTNVTLPGSNIRTSLYLRNFLGREVTIVKPETNV